MKDEGKAHCFRFILHLAAFTLFFALASCLFGCGRQRSDAVVKPAETWAGEQPWYSCSERLKHHAGISTLSIGALTTRLAKVAGAANNLRLGWRPLTVTAIGRRQNLFPGSGSVSRLSEYGFATQRSIS